MTTINVPDSVVIEMNKPPSSVDDASNVAEMAVRLTIGEDNDYLKRLLTNKLIGYKKEYKMTPLTELITSKNRSQLKRSLDRSVKNSQFEAVNTLCEPIGENPKRLRLKQYIKITTPHNTQVNTPIIDDNTNTGTEDNGHNSSPKNNVSKPSQLSVQQEIPNKSEPQLVDNNKTDIKNDNGENHPHVIVDIGSFISNSTTNTLQGNGNNQQVIDVSNNQAVSSWVVNTLLQEKLNYREVQERAEKWKNINGILALIFPIISAVVTGVVQHYLTSSDTCGSQ